MDMITWIKSVVGIVPTKEGRVLVTDIDQFSCRISILEVTGFDEEPK